MRSGQAFMVATGAFAGALVWLVGCNPPAIVDDAAVAAGLSTFNSRCSACHSAGSLVGDRSQIVNNLGTVDASMSGVTLTDDEVVNLKAFLATQ